MKAKKQSIPATDLMKAVAVKAPVKSKIAADFTKEEAAEIKSRLEERTSQKSGRTMTEAERIRREKTIKVKKITKEMEKTNNSKIILFPSYSKKSDVLEWYKLGNLSALYYVYRMADRMGRTARVLKDTDKFAKMKVIASVRDINKFIDQAMQLNEFERFEQTLDGIYILHLRRALADDEIGALKRTEAERKEMMHNVLRPKRADPEVYQAILVIDRQLLPRTAKMQNGYYRTIGDAMAKQILELTQVYFGYAYGHLQPDAAKNQLHILINGLQAGVALLGENNVWGYDIACSTGENLITLRAAVEAMK